MKIRRALPKDVCRIREIIMNFARSNKLVPRTLAEIYSQFRDYFVYEDETKIVGVVSLHTHWGDIAEIRSLAVVTHYQKRGLGRDLVHECFNEAFKIGLQKIFVLVRNPDYFRRFGFKECTREILPPTAWADCIQCPLYPDCNEIPMVKNL